QIRGRVNVGAEDPGGRYGARLDTRTGGLGGATVIAAPPFAQLQVGVPGFPAPTFFLTAGSRVQQVIPNATWGHLQIGFRLHTLGIEHRTYDVLPVES